MKPGPVLRRMNAVLLGNLTGEFNGIRQAEKDSLWLLEFAIWSRRVNTKIRLVKM